MKSEKNMQPAGRRDGETVTAYKKRRQSEKAAARTALALESPGIVPGSTAPKRAEKKPGRRMTVVDEQGRHSEVEVRGRTLYGLERQEQDAIHYVSSDWEAAYHGGLRSPGFEPAVDGASGHGAHLLKLSVQARLNGLRTDLGQRDFDVLIAFVVGGLGPFEAHNRGGGHKASISDDIKRILRKTAGFYSPGSAAMKGLAARDKLWRVAQDVLAHMEATETAPGGELLDELTERRALVERDAERNRPAPQRGEAAAKPGIAANAMAAIQSWAQIEKASVQGFALRSVGHERGILVVATRNDGTEISTTILVSGPYVAAAIDAQLLKAAEAQGWTEWSEVLTTVERFDRRVALADVRGAP